jgi:steroid 5-alpha reductase family enzyme
MLLAVLLWALRLGTFLFIRINRMKRDKRFDGMRERFFAFLRFWLLQGLSVFVVMLAASFAFKQADSAFAPLSYLGLGIFAVGLLIEATADAQKFRFSGNPANKDKWIDVGIWRKTRHPNYLGEMMVWTGIYLLVAPSLVGADSLWALLSPLYIVCLLRYPAPRKSR